LRDIAGEAGVVLADRDAVEARLLGGDRLGEEMVDLLRGIERRHRMDAERDRARGERCRSGH
jgi:hypothetical protein